MDYQDYYETLGVPRTASQAEIKKAFRRLAREHHPDTKPGDGTSERRFKQINEANAVLSDPEKRKKYDLLGANWEQVNMAGAGSAAGNPFAGFSRGGQGGNVRYEFRTSSGGGAGEFSDFFRMFFTDGEPVTDPTGPGRGRRATSGASFEEILGQMGIDGASVGRGTPPSGQARAGRTQAARQPTAEAVAEIELEEAFHGTARRVEIQGKRLEVTIPRGADSGTRVKLSGQGPGGGDLVVVVKVRPHPVFRRKGPNLERDLPVTLREALLGADVPVTTLKGKVLLRIPAGTQSGRIFRLKGQGMPVLRKDEAGDLLVKVRVVLPGDLTPEATKAAEAFLDLLDQPDPR